MNIKILHFFFSMYIYTKWILHVKRLHSLTCLSNYPEKYRLGNLMPCTLWQEDRFTLRIHLTVQIVSSVYTRWLFDTKMTSTSTVQYGLSSYTFHLKSISLVICNILTSKSVWTIHTCHTYIQFLFPYKKCTFYNNSFKYILITGRITQYYVQKRIFGSWIEFTG